METCCSRFTPAEGGARLANAARMKNTIAADHTAFIATRLLHEDAYKIRGPLDKGFKRSIYITRRSRVKCVSYDIGILTDLTVVAAVQFADVVNWRGELENKQVIVCTSEVAERIMDEFILSMANVNVLIIDSCHLIYKDEALKHIMQLYRNIEENCRPRILGLTYPLFSSPKTVHCHNHIDADADKSDGKNLADAKELVEKIEPELKDESNTKDNDVDTVIDKTKELEISDSANENIEENQIDAKIDENNIDAIIDENKIDTKKIETIVSNVGVYKNLDDFNMYEKLEWKLDVLERELDCNIDLAEDIDGVKRLSASMAKPRELIIEYKSEADTTVLPESYVDLENYMRQTVDEVMLFLNEHRYDPTEIYGEDLYEELKGIPDPTIEPKVIFAQFLYVLDQLGPYGADKAAFSLLLKLEKLKIKVPYERHFLLLCLCTTVFVKIRCYSEMVLSIYESDWDKIKLFSTPKVLRLVEVLEKFKPNNVDDATKNGIDVRDATKKLLNEIEKCDFTSLGDKIEDKLNTIQSGLKEIHIEEENKNDAQNKTDATTNPTSKNDASKDEPNSNNDASKDDPKSTNDDPKSILGIPKRQGPRVRGRGRIPRYNNNRAQQMQLNPDALCGIIFIKEPLMAKILFMLVVELTRHYPPLSYLCAQYSAIDKAADPVKEPKEFEAQRKKQEEVLKKFRMHECNLLLATSALEEGIDLPRCNLVLRWDVPASYRSHSLCRDRARAPRSSCVVFSHERGDKTEQLVHYMGTYKELDQVVNRKCGCGIQDEPTQAEEDHADIFTNLVQPYVPEQPKTTKKPPKNVNKNEETDKVNKNEDEETKTVNVNADKVNLNEDKSDDKCSDKSSDKVGETTKGNISDNVKGAKTEDNIASVDLSTATALINKYCGKLPSDTFTRLAPQWWMEKVKLPARDSKELQTAYICTLRLPLNCAVKFNIVGHPMPTKVLARRMVALQACRILHKSGELDNQLMPIGKDNFKVAESEVVSVNGSPGVETTADPNDLARPGTTKRRQYYYKRTARAFTDCQPIIDSTDEEVKLPMTVPPGGFTTNNTQGPKRNMLYLMSCSLRCALPERYNTRGRRLHAPQTARQALAILISRTSSELQIPAFPVYTRSGEVRVSVQYIPDADVRLSPSRGKLVRRFMRFVFADVLRVRRRGMKLQSEGSTHNNYYIVPTIKSTKEDGSTKIDVDWDFLELIYRYTEENNHSDLEKNTLWQQDDEEESKESSADSKEKNDESKEKNDDSKEKNEDSKTTNGIVNENKSDDPNDDVDVKISDVTQTNTDKIVDENDSNITEEKYKSGKANDSTIDSNKIDDKNIDDVKPDIKKEEVSDKETKVDGKNNDKVRNRMRNGKPVKKMANPLLKPGEVFVFDPEKYREAVVTPWYRNQDQPQYFLVAEICWKLSPESSFPSATHTTFRDYYRSKYGVELTQSNQPLLDVDHTSARLNLLTPRYVNRKGVALPVSSERTRRAKRDRLDQKQILVPELCRVHPFAAPLWFATVALPCILYRINALLVADELRVAVAIDVGLGVPNIEGDTAWPALHFGWSLQEVLNADAEKSDKKKIEDGQKTDDDGIDVGSKEEDNSAENENEKENGQNEEEKREKTINEILQEKEEAEGFEIGTWSNEMASSIPQTMEGDEFMEPLPSNITFCTSASGGTNWCDPVKKPHSSFQPSRTFSVADSDCSYMSSDFDTDDSDLNSECSDEDTDTSGFCSSRNSNAAMGVRIEYKTAHEAEAVDLERKKKIAIAPQLDEEDEALDRCEQDRYMKSGCAPDDYLQKFHSSVEKHKKEILEKGLLKSDEAITDILPPTRETKTVNFDTETGTGIKSIDYLFPYTDNEKLLDDSGKFDLEKIEKNKRFLLEQLKQNLSNDEIEKLNCFSMVDINIDSPDYVNEKIANIGFSERANMERVTLKTNKEYVPYYMENKVDGSNVFDFDYQPNLEGHSGPSPSLILQALTMSNANDGINLERLETIGDSFLKFAITAYLYCAHPTVHEGKLSHMRSKQVSNLNLYRLGRARRLGGRMVAAKFEPHDNWAPPCHRPPATLHAQTESTEQDKNEGQQDACFIPYNLITQHSIPDKSIADCVEALIGAYLLSCGPRGALLFMSWLGLRVLPSSIKPSSYIPKESKPSPKPQNLVITQEDSSDDEGDDTQEVVMDDDEVIEDGTWEGRPVGSLRPYKDEDGNWVQVVFGELKAPPSPLLRYIENPEGELERMLSGYDALEETVQYRFNDRSLLLQALTHASHQQNRLTDCYQRLEFLGDAILDYLITRHLFEDSRRHPPGALTDLRSALVNNTIFATLAARHNLHKYFRHMSPGLNEVLTKYVKIQEENGHSISEEHYLIQEDELEQAEDVEVPKALGDLFESVAGAIFLDSGMSLGAVWKSYVNLMGAELEAFSAAAPKSPVRELLEAEPDTAKFGKPERLADGRRVRVCVEVFGRGCFKGIGRNYRIAKGTAARCALRHLKKYRTH